jgi:NADPH:quinone reductase-like Zn-dependent oxidoreductase
MCGTVIDSKSKLLKKGARVASIFLQTHLAGPVREEDMASGLGLPLPGVLTEYRVFPAASLVQVPEYLSDEEASCLPIAGVTSWTSLNWMRPVGQHIGTDKNLGSKYVLLQGTGGVAVAGLQAARAAGYRTIITSSSDEKLERAKKELKADHGINYKTHWEWQELVQEATGGRGADVIFETGGARTIRKSFDSVSFGGVINCIGYLSGKSDEDPDEGGKTPELHRWNVNVLALRRNVTLRGIINGGKDRFEEMLGFYKEKQIRPVVSKVFAFEEAKEAMKYLADGKHFGKVVIKVADS